MSTLGIDLGLDEAARRSSRSYKRLRFNVSLETARASNCAGIRVAILSRKGLRVASA